MKIAYWCSECGKLVQIIYPDVLESGAEFECPTCGGATILDLSTRKMRKEIYDGYKEKLERERR